MTMTLMVPGLPGMGSAKTATHRIVFKQGDWLSALALGKIISGASSRDHGNTGDLDVLRPGTLMGKITATSEYAPTVLGVVASAYTSGGTELTVSAAQAVEIARRVGSSGTGTLKAIGPPTAAGTVASTSITFSAVNTSTGVITVTSLGVDKVAGTLITAADGSETPITLIPDGYGIKVTDNDGTSIDVPFPHFPIAGVIISANILPVWPSDTSIRAWIVSSLNTYGKFVFDHGY